MASFILSIRYTAPLEEVDKLMDDHVAWLKAGREAGVFVGWGRKVPREGGIVLAVGDNRAMIEKAAAADPFVTGGVAEVSVVEWAPSFLGAGVEGLAP